MPRWEPDARGRLTAAALDLYGEQGFDATTVAAVAERAGLTERTFFHHFADKREVLFPGEADELVLAALDDVPASAPPVDAVLLALEAPAALFRQRRGVAERRHAVIAANASLQEREAIKLARLASAMADALRRRGADPSTAKLTAEVGVAVFKFAYDLWIEDVDHRDFGDLLRGAFAQLRTAIITAQPQRTATGSPAP